MPRLLTAFALFAVLISLALAPAAPVPKDRLQQDPIYYPTKVGTKLVYDCDGAEDTRVVTKVENVDAGTMVTTEEVNRDGTRTPCEKVLVTPKGLFVTAERYLVYDPPWCLLPSPHKPGAKWEATYNLADVKVQRRMTARNVERLTTPAGEFTAACVDCEFTLQGRNETAKYWYAPGIGLIRLDHKGTTRMLLKSFIPGK